MQKDYKSVPQAMRVHLGRLFGKNSVTAKTSERTMKEWKKTFNRVLDELEKYLEENIDTDELHHLMLLSGIYAARESLVEEEELFGYIEGITRLAFLLMGDLPDHRQRKPGRKRADHYKLNMFRTTVYTQTPYQKLNTLLYSGKVGFLKFKKNPREALNEFRDLNGFKANYKDFFRWYKQTYPDDYSKIF
jgi:hypothetical protein